MLAISICSSRFTASGLANITAKFDEKELEACFSNRGKASISLTFSSSRWILDVLRIMKGFGVDVWTWVRHYMRIWFLVWVRVPHSDFTSRIPYRWDQENLELVQCCSITLGTKQVDLRVRATILGVDAISKCYRGREPEVQYLRTYQISWMPGGRFSHQARGKFVPVPASTLL